MTSALAASGWLANEGSGTAEEIGAPPWLLGVLAFGTLCLLLFLVTRFNRDR